MLEPLKISIEHNKNTVEMLKISQALNKHVSAIGVKSIYKWYDFSGLDKVPQTKMFMLYTQDALPGRDWNTINTQLHAHDKNLLVYTDNFLGDLKLSNITFKNHPTLIGINSLHIDANYYHGYTDSHQPKKKFNCFMQRIDPVRQSWFYFLYLRGLLEQGYVSFLLYQLPNSDLPQGKELFDYTHQSRKLGQVPYFEQAYQYLKTRVPYVNFTENKLLHDKILDSKYSVVLDTSAVLDDQESWFLSEKAYRALMIPTIDLMFVQKGCLTKMQELGLESSSQHLNFDHLPWVERQQEILNILEHDTLLYNYKELREKSRHNQHILEQMLTPLDRLFDEIVDTLNSIDIAK